MPIAQQASTDAKDVPKQQQEARSSWWNWRRNKSSRETTPALENAIEIKATDKTADTKDEVMEEVIVERGKFKQKFTAILCYFNCYFRFRN